MASQQQPRPLFRFASMIRPAPVAQPPAPPAPAPQPVFRPPVAAPFRPPASTTTTTTATTTVTTTQPSQPQETRPQTPVAAASPPRVVAQLPTPPQPQPQPQPPVSVPRSPILSPRPQPVAAPSPRPTPTPTPTPRSPLTTPAPAPVVVSPPKVPPPVAATAARSPVNNATPSVPQSPFKKPSAPTSTPYSSLPPSPKTKPQDDIQNLIYQSSSSPSKAPSPPQKVIQPLVKTQTYSPPPQVKPAAISHPPSPLKLPPPQLDLESNMIPPQVEQKTVVVQETTARGNTRNGRIEENGKIKKDKGVHQHKKEIKSDTSDDFGMSVLTLAGENKGAIMELSPSRNKNNNNPQTLHNKLASPKAWRSSSSEDESGNKSGKAKTRDHHNKNKSQLPMTAFMNSNVQGVNNSILHNASCTHHDPGVHLVFARKTNGGHHGFHIKGSPKS